MVRRLAPHLHAAMRDLALVPDERGLMALAEARLRVRAASAFTRGKSHRIPGQKSQPTDADYLWAALLSLSDGAEFSSHAARLVWRHSPAPDDEAPVERYGVELLPWLEQAIAEDGRVNHRLPFVSACLLALGVPALQAVLRVRDPINGDANGFHFLEAWLTRWGRPGWRALAARATGGDANAQRGLARLAARAPAQLAVPTPPLEVECILSVLDAAAAAPNGGERMAWPSLVATVGHFEFHAMRVALVRAARGDDWGLLLEVVQGDVIDAEARWPAVVQRYTYGSRVTSGGRYLVDARPVPVRVRHLRVSGAVDCTLGPELAKMLDLRPGRSSCGAVEQWGAVLAIRAAVALGRDALFLGDRAIVQHLAVPGGRVIARADLFEHVAGPARLPSASIAYRSFAEVLVTREPGRLRAGRVRTEWRAHARKRQPFTWNTLERR